VAAPKRYSLADVRRSYTPAKARAELRGELPAYLLYRPLSFPIAWLLLRLGVPTIAVTAGCGALAVAVLAAAISGGAHAYLCVAGCGLAFHVLDCVDGNMARTTGEASRFGALLDGLCDYAFWSALLCALGVLAGNVPLGMGCAIVVLLGRDVRQHYALLFGAPAVLADGTSAISARQWLLYALAGLENLYAPAIGLAGALGKLALLLDGVALYVGAIAFASTLMALGKARRSDSDRAQHEAGVLPTERE
jgi:phosphatidylglycerophosphate synthase